MKNIEELSIEIIDDVAKIWQEYIKIDALINDNKISKSQLLKRIYVALCKAETLDIVLDEMRRQGYQFNDKEVKYLDNLIEEMGELSDIANTDELTDDDEQSIKDIVEKYKDFLPEDFIENSAEID